MKGCSICSTLFRYKSIYIYVFISDDHGFFLYTHSVYRYEKHATHATFNDTKGLRRDFGATQTLRVLHDPSTQDIRDTYHVICPPRHGHGDAQKGSQEERRARLNMGTYNERATTQDKFITLQVTGAFLGTVT